MLAEGLTALGVSPLQVDRREDGLWYGTFEAGVCWQEPEATIETMLAAIESLGEAERRVWWDCKTRELNIGYECGGEPWAFNQGISGETLRRVAKVGAGLRITLYPETPLGTIQAQIEEFQAKSKTFGVSFENGEVKSEKFRVQSSEFGVKSSDFQAKSSAVRAPSRNVRAQNSKKSEKKGRTTLLRGRKVKKKAPSVEKKARNSKKKARNSEKKA